MDFITLLHRRYSCRSFSPRVIERETIDRILEAGRIAPTAVNRQPVYVWAIDNRVKRFLDSGFASARNDRGKLVLKKRLW